jgi:hypothetical protein
MITSYLTDEITIVTVTVDTKGVVTESESSTIKARVEDTNELIRDSKGKEVKANMNIFLSQRTLNYQDKVKIKKKNGRNFIQPDKKWEIKKINYQNMFKNRYLELVV